MDEGIITSLFKAMPYAEAIGILIATFFTYIFQTIVRKLVEEKTPKEEIDKTYSERLSELTQNLGRSTKEVDKIFASSGLSQLTTNARTPRSKT